MDLSASNRSSSSVESVIERNEEEEVTNDDVVEIALRAEGANPHVSPGGTLAGSSFKKTKSPHVSIAVGDGASSSIPYWVDSIVDAKIALSHRTTADTQLTRHGALSIDGPQPRQVNSFISTKDDLSTSSSPKQVDDVDNAVPAIPTAQAVEAEACTVKDRTIEEERENFRQHVRSTLEAEVVQAEAVLPTETTPGPPIEPPSHPKRQSLGFFCGAVTLILMVVVATGVGVEIRHQLRKPVLSLTLSPSATVALSTRVPSVAPVLLPDGRLAFTATAQLYIAVDAYMAAINANGTAKDSTVALQFGHPIGTWDVSRLSDFSRVFNMDRFQRIDFDTRFSQRSRFNESLSGWDMSNATTLHAMFAGATDFVGEGIANWNVGKVTDFSFMFFQADAFASSVAEWNTSSAAKMNAMFYRAASFSSLVSLWDVSKVESMPHMFAEATMFSGDGISQWTVSNVRDMSHMFRQATIFNATVSSWDTRSVEKMEYMFKWASTFSGNVSSWSVGKVTSMEGLFSSAKSFVGGDLTRWDTSRVTDMTYIFDRSGFRGDVSTWDVSRVTRFEDAFAHCDKLDSDLSRWNTGNAKIMSGMFDHARMFASNISSWNTSKVTHMFEMFHHADAFNSDVSGWDVSNVVDVSGMFNDAEIYAQNLCAWGPKLQPSVDVVDMFIGSACTDKSDPSTDPAVGTGPLCAVCV